MQGERTRRVLVVDGDPYRRVFLVQLLMELGLRVLMAGSAEEARAILASLGARVGAAIVSAGLPDEPGDILAASLAEEDAARLVLLVTSAEELPPAGVAKLERPVTRDKLAGLLQPLLA